MNDWILRIIRKAEYEIRIFKSNNTVRFDWNYSIFRTIRTHLR